MIIQQRGVDSRVQRSEMSFKLLLTMLLLFVCLNSVEARKTKRLDRYKACIHKVKHLTDQMVECRGMFICDFELGYGARCIPNSQVCDGHVNCKGGKDEANCPPKTPNCQDFKIPCPGENKCATVCNGVTECLSRIDEYNCDIKCDKGRVQCSDGKCAVVGDGHKECDDNADENCPVGPPCKECEQCETCETCEICKAYEVSCVHKTSNKRECVSTCDDVIECVDEKDKTPLSTCPPTCRRGSDWIRFGASCYLIVRDDLSNHAQAQENCFVNFPGAHLVVVETEPELDFLAKTLIDQDAANSMQPGVHYWINGEETAVNRVFAWTPSNALVNTNFYGPSQPNSSGANQDCLALWGLSNYLISDEACASTFMYVCEDNDPL